MEESVAGDAVVGASERGPREVLFFVFFVSGNILEKLRNSDPSWYTVPKPRK